ncbi:MAG: hypothetical protein IJE74_01595 [Clostridia bacterium]|nr:hypothetical protein [Clostridia bacterium]
MNIMKKIIAVLAASSILFALNACDGKNQPETTAAPTQTETVKEETTDILLYTETVAETTARSTAEATTQAETTTEVTTQAETTTEIETITTAPTTTKKVITTTKKAVTTTKKAANTTKKPTTTKKKVVAPTSKEDIVKLYNAAAAAAAKSKPGYQKSTTTVLNNLDMGALASISAVRDAVGGFLGEGSSSSTVKKGSFDGTSLVKSTLKASDVTSATCKLSSDGKYYTINITVKNEQNPKKGSSALGRFTKDYKDIDEIKAGLADVGASVESLTVNTTNVTISAKINAANNRFISLSHNIKMKAVLNNVKYSFVKVGKASANLETKVTYSDFKY